MKRRIAIRLKVPDNTAYTALVALRRLGVPVAHVERARLVQVEGESAAAMLAAVERDEELFNPNLHEIRLLDADRPVAGEMWVWPRDARSDIVAWRLAGESGEPLDAPSLQRACDVLLCNNAVEEATFP
ncbi:MAG TPA: hypothetical protein VIN40_05195 [Candidatus Tyrphobacter sp.]